MESIGLHLDLHSDWKTEPPTSPFSQDEKLPLTEVDWSCYDLVNDILPDCEDLFDIKGDGVTWIPQSSECINFAPKAQSGLYASSQLIGVPNTELTPPQSPPQYPTSPSTVEFSLHPYTVSEDELRKALQQNAFYIDESATASSTFGNLSPTLLKHEIPLISPVAISESVSSSLSPGVDLEPPTPAFNFNLPLCNVEDENIQHDENVVDDIVFKRLWELYDSGDATQSTASECSDSSYGGGSLSSSSSSSSSSSCSSSPIGKIQTLKKRTRPYGRDVEDRKLRKKEQNKNAATRYRQKKKQEMECDFQEEQELLQRNEELQKTLKTHSDEAKYLKKLLREFCKDI